MKSFVGAILISLIAATAGYCAPPDLAVNLPAIPEIHSLEELRATQPFRVKGWDVRVGIADGGRDAGAWKILYCFAKPRDGEVASAPSGNIGRFLGPIIVKLNRIEENNVERSLKEARMAARLFERREWLCAKIIPLASKGKWELTVCSPDPEKSPTPLLRSTLEVDADVPVYWHQFAQIERYQDGQDETRFRNVIVNKPYAVVPEIDDLANLLPAANREDAPSNEFPEKENRLPGGVPLLGGWAAVITGDKNSATPDAPPLVLSMADGEFTLHSRGPKMTDWADCKLLARWWVNQRAIVAPRATTLHAMQQSRAINVSLDMHIRFGLPLTLGDLKNGDHVSLQLMYSPNGYLPVFESDGMGIQQMRELQIQGAVQFPLSSNVLELVVNEKMLSERK